MLRWALFILFIGLAGVGAAWIAGHPGNVSLEWLGHRIDTSVAVLLLLIVMLAIVVAVLYRLWWSLRRAPRLLTGGFKDRRQRLGLEALSQGLVAVAAGDAETARRQSRRAADLLPSPLTMLLSAQAAQLTGDDRAAQRYFTALRQTPETEFLGVRGLLTQAIGRSDWTNAMDLAKRAHRLNPKSPWVVSTLLDLHRRAGQWTDVQATFEEAVRLKLIPEPEVSRQRAEILYQRSLAATGSNALDLAHKAVKADPGYTAAVAREARLLLADNRARKAADVVEAAWAKSPDRDMAELYWQARQCDDGFKKLDAAKRLGARNPGHLESRLLIAEAAIEARQWGEARTQLEPVAGDDASPRVCRLMAELEEGEHGDLARARSWLVRATRRDGETGHDGGGPIVQPPPLPA